MEENCNGNRINDTMNEMTEKVCERLNISINYIRNQFISSQRAAFENTVVQSILAGESSYDVVESTQTFTSLQLENPYFYDLVINQYIDSDKPWRISHGGTQSYSI